MALLSQEWDIATNKKQRGLSKKNFTKIFQASPLSDAFEEEEFDEVTGLLY